MISRRSWDRRSANFQTMVGLRNPATPSLFPRVLAYRFPISEALVRRTLNTGGPHGKIGVRPSRSPASRIPGRRSQVSTVVALWCASCVHCRACHPGLSFHHRLPGCPADTENGDRPARQGPVHRRGHPGRTAGVPEIRPDAKWFHLGARGLHGAGLYGRVSPHPGDPGQRTIGAAHVRQTIGGNLRSQPGGSQRGSTTPAANKPL